MLSEKKRDELEVAAGCYVDSLTCISEVEKDELKDRAVNHAIFCDNWKQLVKYIDSKEGEIILYGKMKPDPKALDFGSFE